MKSLNCRVSKSTSNYTNFFGKDAKGQYHTGCDIETKRVYSVCNGVVLAIHEQNSGLYIVTVQHNANQCVRYGHMQYCAVEVGDPIQDGQLVGIAEQFVHFEFIKRDASDKTFPVRVGSQTYYKVDPLDLSVGALTLSRSPEERHLDKWRGVDNPEGWSLEMLSELSDGRGED